jgi:phospholipid/cholesterol/gamma-HCH transport system substrate-binding protein
MFKLTNEVKIALLAIAAILLAVWGFKYLKGQNILTTSNTYYVRYESADQLMTSSPVFVKGFQVGMVKDMYIDPEDDKTIIAVLNVEAGVDVPKETIAAIVSVSLMGGKAIELIIPHPCDGDCAPDGAYLKGESRSFLQSVVGDPSQIDAYTTRLQSGLVSVWDSIADPNDPQGAGRAILALEKSLANIERVTLQITCLLDASTANIQATLANTASITRTLSSNNQDIAATLSNLSAISAQLKAAGIDKASQKAALALDSITTSLTTLKSTLQNATNALGKVDTLAGNLSQGKGSAGLLLTDATLYHNLVRTSRQLHLLLQDLRLNPKRYNTIKVKVFGKNNTSGYANPLDDPAYQSVVDSLERSFQKITPKH